MSITPYQYGLKVIGSTCTSDRRSQALHLQVLFGNRKGVGPQGFEVGHRRNRQSRPARPGIHVLENACNEPNNSW